MKMKVEFKPFKQYLEIGRDDKDITSLVVTDSLPPIISVGEGIRAGTVRRFLHFLRREFETAQILELFIPGDVLTIPLIETVIHSGIVSSLSTDADVVLSYHGILFGPNLPCFAHFKRDRYEGLLTDRTITIYNRYSIVAAAEFLPHKTLTDFLVDSAEGEV
jgi:hypothetical protein